MEQGRGTSLRLGQGGQKLIPRDISESLGKLPPQDISIEENVLGALMLEVKATERGPAAIDRVKFLKPEHFYLDQHKEIYTAIQLVVQEGSLPDMRMVTSKLREIGKLELVGNAYYVLQLTTGVQSADNIIPHARRIVEHAMKRAMIQIASQIHHDAYEDTTDVFDLLQRVRDDFKFLEERETASSGPERIKANWEKYRIIAKPERPRALIQLNGVDVCTEGNISLLVGKKKSRKSLLVTYLLSIFLRPREHVANNLVAFDTEQEEYDVWMAMERLYRMTNQMIPIFCLRGLSPKERRDFIEQTVIHWPYPLKIIVIDGVRDCMSNINDPDESTEVMSWQMRLNVEHKIHIMDVLHLNKTDNNARGHIGTELLNKAEITIEVIYDPKTDLSTVRCESSRRKPFDDFLFTHGPTGLPELLGAPVGEESVNQEEKLKRISAVFEGETLGNKEVRQEICSQFGVGDNKARKLLAEFIRMGWINKSGNNRSPNVTYRMSANAQVSKQVEMQINTPPTLNTVVEPESSTDELPF